jgi:hypothetical protein
VIIEKGIFAKEEFLGRMMHLERRKRKKRV